MPITPNPPIIIHHVEGSGMALAETPEPLKPWLPKSAALLEQLLDTALLSMVTAAFRAMARPQAMVAP